MGILTEAAGQISSVAKSLFEALAWFSGVTGISVAFLLFFVRRTVRRFLLRILILLILICVIAFIVFTFG